MILRIKMEDPYSKREEDDWRLSIKDQLTRIEVQTTKTNGRVSKLEGWKSLIVGASIVVWFVVIPLIIYIFLDRISHISNAITGMRETITELQINK